MINPSHPLQNRVLPTGEVVAIPSRGTFTGNRGIIHRPDMTLGTARWSHPHWIICTLTHPRGRYHGPMPHRAWTALFFLDEAVALAAGHRPCAYCRREAYNRYAAAWAKGHGEAAKAPEMDQALHSARIERPRGQRRHHAKVEDLPDYSFILWREVPHLLLGSQIVPFSPEGYGAPMDRPSGEVAVLTPRPTLTTLAAGYRPDLHPTCAP